MRNSFALIGYITILTAPLAVGTTLAHDIDTTPAYMTPTYFDTNGTSPNSNIVNVGRVHQASAALPRYRYEHGTQFVVNPTEMTNTRDNRGSNYNRDTTYQPAAYPAPSTSGSMTTTYQEPPSQTTTYESTTYSTTTESR